MSHHGEPDRAITEMRGWDELEERDWAPGGPEGLNIRTKGGQSIPHLRVICDPRTPCWLC